MILFHVLILRNKFGMDDGVWIKKKVLQWQMERAYWVKIEPEIWHL